MPPFLKLVLKYYFENPEEILMSAFKEGVNKEDWKKAVALTDKERSRCNLVTATSILDEDSGDGHCSISQKPGLQTAGSQLPFLSIVFWVKRANTLPRTDVFSFYTLKYSLVNVIRALKMVDTSGFDCGAPPWSKLMHGTAVQRHVFYD
jgi:hypothetical protein